MAWTDIPLSQITFGLFTGSTPGATVSVAAADLLMCRYKVLARDTITVDFRIGKAFFTPSTAGVAGITMELKIPFSSIYFPALGAPSAFNDGGQTYSNDCVIALDPGGIPHVAGCVAVLNESSRKIVLLIRNVPGDNINTVGVVGAFGQITFEVGRKRRLPIGIGKSVRGRTLRGRSRR
jgi:hypothetical protein